jgi:predicted nucleic acid-binding protein
MKGQAQPPALFDTDVLIWYFRGASRAYEVLSRTPYELRWISSICVMELIQGSRNKQEMNYPAASPGVSRTKQRRENIIGASSGVSTRGAMKIIMSFIKENISRIIHPDEKISEKAISLMQAYALSHGLRTTDAIIASSAINNKAALITGNHRHFTMINALKVIKYQT